MSTGLAVLVFCASLAVTLAATVVFAREIDRAGERMGVSEGLHGILTALGADAPEISTAVAALVAGHATIGVGVVVGSNVFNLAALLGLSALVAGRVHMHRHGLLLNGGVAVAITALAAAQILGALGSVAATVLLFAVFGPYVWLLAIRPAGIRRLVPFQAVRHFLVAAVHEEERDVRTGARVPSATRRDLAVLAASLVAIVAGAVGMVHTATDLGARWGVSDVVIGTLVLAALTSLPNVLTAVRLALHGRGAATVSEAFNSNSLNILAGITLPSLVVALGNATGIEVFSIWWLVGTTVVAVGLAYSGGGLRRPEGGVVVALYVVFAAVIASR